MARHHYDMRCLAHGFGRMVLFQKIQLLRIMKKQKLTREEMKAKREAMRTPRSTKPIWYFLFWNGEIVFPPIHQDSVHANSEEEAREHFAKVYKGELLNIRKDKPFTKAEITKAKKKLCQ
jgi:hypothetical protein